MSGVAKNGMGCFVPGCFVLHSFNLVCYRMYDFIRASMLGIHVRALAFKTALFFKTNY